MTNSMNASLKRGNVREDGKVFWQYKRGREYWVAAEDFEHRKNLAKEISRRFEEGSTGVSAAPEKKAARNASKGKWATNNRERSREASKRWKLNNPQRVRIHNRMMRHKRRAQIKGSAIKVTAKDLSAIESAAKGRCHYCGIKGRLSFDHIDPLARGGAHAKDNIVMACPSCNSKKNAKPPWQFAASIGRLLI